VTLVVGPEARLFACHESVLCHSPYFASLCREQYLEVANKRVDLPDEAPEVLSSVLEYLYKGDYYPRLAYDKKHGTWELEDDGNPKQESTVYHPTSAVYILKVCPFVSNLIRSSSLPINFASSISISSFFKLCCSHSPGHRHLLLSGPVRTRRAEAAGPA
jgi:BTB/POZ domain